MLAGGTIDACTCCENLGPAAVVGFGGYPTLPPLVAARLVEYAGVVHNANAVLGRANRFLARRADRDCNVVSRCLQQGADPRHKNNGHGDTASPGYFGRGECVFRAA